MSQQEENAPASSQNEENAATSSMRPDPRAPQTDYYLQELVDIVNTSKQFEPPVTLFLSGTVVTGRIVSGREYFAALREQFSQFLGANATEENLDFFTKAPTEVYTKERTATDPMPAFIHLREARIISPGQPLIPTEGSWWRGRLSQVDAFHFGTLSAVKND